MTGADQRTRVVIIGAGRIRAGVLADVAPSTDEPIYAWLGHGQDGRVP